MGLLPHILVILIHESTALTAVVKPTRPTDTMEAATMEPLVGAMATPNTMNTATLEPLVRAVAILNTMEVATLEPLVKTMATPTAREAPSFVVHRQATRQGPNPPTIATPNTRHVPIGGALVQGVHRQATRQAIVMLEPLFPPLKVSLLTPLARIRDPWIGQALRHAKVERNGSRMRRRAVVVVAEEVGELEYVDGNDKGDIPSNLIFHFGIGLDFQHQHATTLIACQ